MLYSIQVGAVPIFRQIVQRITHQVASGRLASGTLMPSARDVAKDLVINPMTVSKAYGLLVDAGVLQRTRGAQLVVAGVPLPEEMRVDIIKPYVRFLLEVAKDLGFERKEAIFFYLNAEEK